MRVLLLSAGDSGGAGRVALRLAEGLPRRGETTEMLVSRRTSNESFVREIDPENPDSIAAAIKDPHFSTVLHVISDRPVTRLRDLALGPGRTHIL